MPKFNIKTVENGREQTVLESVEFPTEKGATDDAQRALADMAQNRLPDGKRDAFGVMVSDERGEPIYRASLEFRAETAEDIRAQQNPNDETRRARALHAALTGRPWSEVESALAGDNKTSQS